MESGVIKQRGALRPQSPTSHPLNPLDDSPAHRDRRQWRGRWRAACGWAQAQGERQLASLRQLAAARQLPRLRELAAPALGGLRELAAPALGGLGRRRPSRGAAAAAGAAALLVVLLLDMYFWGLVMPHYTYHAYRRRWARLYTGSDWARLAAVKSKLPRYELPPGPFPPFPIRVLSLARSAERRAAMAAQLDARNIPFEFVDAVDGNGALPEEEVERYASGERLYKYRRAKLGDPAANARYKVACDLSHYRLMYRLLGEGAPFHLVLEDDAVLQDGGDGGGGFMAVLERTLRALPADWDVLHLSLCQATHQGYVGEGVRLYSRGFCTLGLAYTRAAALRVLQEAALGTRNVDNVLADLAGMAGGLASYVAYPPLLARNASLASEIDLVETGAAKDPF